MSSALHKKKILFFAPQFFNYEKRIVEKLREMGAHVDHFDERPKNSFKVKALIRINRNLIRKTIDKYYYGIHEKTAAQKYDYVFVVNLEAMTPEIVESFRKQQPQAIFILYMWDSIKNKKPALTAFTQFDWCYSFDKNDAEQLTGVYFRPLFFIDDYDKDKWIDEPDQSIGVTFIGTVHSDRYNLVNNVKNQIKDLGFSTFFYMYFHSKILFYYKKIKDIRFINAGYREFMFTPIASSEIVALVKQSKAILDIQHPDQTGLTMRSIEMLGAGRKLITTNKEIAQYDFFNPLNILIIDRAEPLVTSSFIQSGYVEVDKETRHRYALEGWIKEVFRMKE